MKCQPENEQHLGLLDGLRGAMAFWVFYGHLKIVCLGEAPRIGHPANAVEVFMFLSGFLMAYHWAARQGKYESGRAQALDFYVRRFFRIAPLYYLMFAVAWFGQDYFFSAAREIAGKVSGGDVTETGVASMPLRHRLTDALAHVSFVFGALPKYVASNILPDWSIGLEMQFYLVFPLSEVDHTS